MFIVKDGYIFCGVCAVLTILTWYFVDPVWAVVPFVLGVYFAYFFRDEIRPCEYDPDILYSPADGTVMSVEDIEDKEYIYGPAKKVVIFLSVFDVHVNRSPIDGEIKYQRYTMGRFIPAFDKNASFENERFAIGMDNGRFKVLVVQVAGLLARRIVSWVNLGHSMEQGERYGMIKFGSSTELIVPRDFEIFVKKGDKVTGGVTVVGRVPR